ncbi:MAG: V0D/AC39 family V-type ATPase subunit, partial [Lachnospiraceae bacterium]
ISLVKACLCSLFSIEKIQLDFSVIHDFFLKHTGIDLNALGLSTTISEFINNTADSDLYQLLSNISQQTDAGLAEYGMALDTYYFTQFWKKTRKYLKGRDLESVTCIYGTEIDMLNFMWIYRAKKYLNFSTGQIYSMIIPIHHKLKASQLTAMIEADSVESLLSLMEVSYYGKFVPDDGKFSPEDIYYKLQDTVNNKISRHNPYSAAVINEYLYKKETECNRIISIIEGIRYGMDTNSILANI